MGKINLLTTALRAKGMVGLDACFFIYQFENHPKYARICSAIISLIEDGKIEAFTSTISLSEVLAKPIKLQRHEQVLLLDQAMHDIPHLSLIPIDSTVAKIAAHFRATYGFRLPDCLHLASTFSTGADLFLTNDNRLKSIKTPKVLCLSDYMD